ncbi:MAG TPA: VCBS repeat-containing protein, partial [Ohtaekwangia sp.]|uniref:FG-GAP repeat domain-containing protein n=1 Tax=Ohtaekwangia sp. TaxID=2066019 RepID=UPI002F92BD1A
MPRRFILLILFIFIIAGACKQEMPATLFTKLPETETGITFRNLLKEENPDFNILHYPYFYNGGGVAAGDVNNDGLTDLFFTGNMVKNRLFLNRGNLRFDDITTRANIASKEGWCTGVTMADVNHDGWLDIYVCRSGFSNSRLRKNLLFINMHDLSFTEQAEAYGLADAGYSTQASFLDYDRDGDLDMILINQSSPEYARGQLDYMQLRNQPADPLLENKLFRNDNGKFTDVTHAAGIYSGVFTFSLGISTADV